jgi:hypothetical protein
LFVRGENSDTIPVFGFPLVDLDEAVCNCVAQGKTVNVKSTTGLAVAVSSDDDTDLAVSDHGDDNNDSDHGDGQQDFRGIQFLIEGGTYSQEHQHVLKHCWGNNLETILEREEDNPRDKNAVAIKVKIEDEFRLVGYLPKERSVL